MTKTVILTFATIFGIGGGFIPYLWGDANFFSGWRILTSTIGGLVGIWVGVLVVRRFGL